MNVGGKKLVEGLLILTFLDLALYCLHNGAFVLKEITQLQERAESENKMATRIEQDSNGKTLYLVQPLYDRLCHIEN